MAKKSQDAPEKKTPELDPILPLPHNTGIPFLREGEGKDILDTKSPVRTVELSYRAFYVMWEQAEALAKRNYPKYVDGPMDNVAQAALEAVIAFRNVWWCRDLAAVSEKEAVRVRELERKRPRRDAQVRKPTSGDPSAESGTRCNACEGAMKPKKSKKTGDRYLKCEKCGNKTALTSSGEARKRPLEARKSRNGVSGAAKGKTASQKNGKKALKKTTKAKK